LDEHEVEFIENKVKAMEEPRCRQNYHNCHPERA
jgi:hypothetical protein